ncbi:hypothetical protein MMC17_009592 [Xylographa soralifera]|nr:hypothetical protein [Xylographa soralifera]
MLAGELPYRVQQLHNKYGKVVRVAPNELSFIDAAAWRDIYIHKEYIRPWEWRNRLPGKDSDHFISAGVENHTRFRKIFNAAFSEKALREQEPIIQSYVTKLMDRFQEIVDRNSPETSGVVNLVEYFNWATFDIIGDLGWGHSFECLEKKEYHPWITVILHFKATLFVASLKYYPLLDRAIQAITPAAAMASIKMVIFTAEENVKERLSRKTDRPDFMSFAIKYNASSESSGISVEEMECNSMAFIVGGSDTITTALVGTVNCLLHNPEAYAHLIEEVRSTFASEDAINYSSTNTLTYLNAVIEEGLRMCPPVPDIMRRQIAGGDTLIAGHAVPDGTVVGIPMWSTFQSSANFTKPNEFHPERWQPQSSGRFNDNKAAFQPFSTGPANCIGQNLARYELRVILCRLFWRYNVVVPDGQMMLDWSSQKIWWSWEKKPVSVKLTSAQRSG